MVEAVLERHGLSAAQLAVVGDRLYTDIAMAQAAGALGVLVLTGESSADDARYAPQPPDLVVPDLEEFGRLLKQAHQLFHM
jgi:NagD protein